MNKLIKCSLAIIAIAVVTSLGFMIYNAITTDVYVDYALLLYSSKLITGTLILSIIGNNFFGYIKLMKGNNKQDEIK